MNYRNAAIFLAFAIMAGSLTVADSFAQGRSYGQGQQQPQGRGRRQGDGQQQGRGGGPQPGQQARSGASNQQQSEIRERFRTRDIYGRDLMTAAEQRQYRDRVNAATTDRQWAQIREQHMNEMRRRAQASGQALDRPVYGQHMLTRQELEQYRMRLDAAQSETERARIRSEHQDMIRDRARLLGIDPPAIE